MARFLARRGLQAAVTLLLATLVVHVAVTVLPGDPVRALFGIRRPPPELVEMVRTQYHLDEPYVVQYALYLRDVVMLDFGQTLRGADVNGLIAAAWPSTAWLVGLALVAQAVLGLAAGVFTAVRPATWTTRAVLVAASLMLAVPVVLSAPALHHLLAIRWSILPVNAAAGGWHAHLLPLATLVTVTLGTLVLFLRQELRQALRASFARFATACGLPRRRVVGVHALRVALPPVIGYLASNLGIVIVGVFVIEGTMGIGGLGSLLLDAISGRDRSIVVSTVMLVTFVVILLNLLADVLVAAVDPRARQDVEGETA